MQYAWLEYDTGFWLLLTDDKSKGNGKVRTWVDKTAALCELADEGWTLRRPNSKRHRLQASPKSKFQGYTLARTVQ
jgi:hypothetical protein